MQPLLNWGGAMGGYKGTTNRGITWEETKAGQHAQHPM